MTATPRPWHVSRGYIASDADGYVPIITPFTPDAHRDQHGNPSPEALANAELIVEAANFMHENPNLANLCLANKDLGVAYTDSLVVLRGVLDACVPGWDGDPVYTDPSGAVSRARHLLDPEPQAGGGA